MINLASGWIFILLFSQKNANTDNVNHQFDLDKRGVLQYDAKKTNWCQHKGYQWKTLSHSIFGRTHSVVISPKSCLIFFWLYKGKFMSLMLKEKKGRKYHIYIYYWLNLMSVLFYEEMVILNWIQIVWSDWSCVFFMYNNYNLAIIMAMKMIKMKMMKIWFRTADGPTNSEDQYCLIFKFWSCLW